MAMFYLPAEHTEICIVFLLMADIFCPDSKIFNTYRCQMFLGGSVTGDIAPADSLDFVVFFSFILFYFPRGFRILGNIWLEITSYYYYKKSFLLWKGT